MKGKRHVLLPSVLLTCVVVAVGLASSGFGLFGGGGKRSTAAAPSCLPTTLAGSARISGTGLAVSPAPGSVTASPRTQISFLGTDAADLRELSVTGSRSGVHSGHLYAYSQGDGASFLTRKSFDPGERVSVRALAAGIAGHPQRLAFAFRVDSPYATVHEAEFPNPPAPPGSYESFETVPGVQAPILTVTTPDRDPGAGEVLTSNGPGAGQYGPLIYTPRGRLVWFARLSHGLSAEDLSVQSYEGQRDLTMWEGRVLDLGFGEGEDLVLSSRYQTVARVRAGNGLSADLHEFQIAPRGIAYITAYNPIRCDLASQHGARSGAIIDTAIQEIDMRTGLVRWEWHSLDHIGVAESETSPPSGTPWDWFHLNSIDPEPGGNLLISARSTWASYQLEGGSGVVLWRLGGTNSSFRMGAGTRTAWQHDARLLPDGEVTLFDDGSNPPVHPQSRALRIALDLHTHEARLRAAYTHPGLPLLSASQGNAQTLPVGGTVVEYGGVPEISEYDADGALLFDAHLSYEMSSYRGFRFPWVARPSTPPAILASLNNTSEETIVHMSWNGSTEVVAWRVLAGAGARASTPQATVPVAGFETSTILSKAYHDVAVEALGSRGQVLGTSAVTRVLGYEAALRGK